MRPIQLTFLLLVGCRQAVPVPLHSVQCPFTSHTFGPTDLLHPSPAPHFKISNKN
jgi:hypothetical protein